MPKLKYKFFSFRIQKHYRGNMTGRKPFIWNYLLLVLSSGPHENKRSIVVLTLQEKARSNCKTKTNNKLQMSKEMDKLVAEDTDPEWENYNYDPGFESDVSKKKKHINLTKS